MASDPGQIDRRRAAIREIISGEELGNQAELVDRLRERGFHVTQSSVSRDLRELAVAKVGGVYQLADGAAAPARPSPERVAEEVRRTLRTIARAGPNLLVLHTLIGSAPRLGLVLDQAGWDEVVGTIAGDDTIFIATPDARARDRVIARLESMSALAAATA